MKLIEERGFDWEDSNENRVINFYIVTSCIQ